MSEWSRQARQLLAAAILQSKHGKQGYCKVVNSDFNCLRKFLSGRLDGYQIDHICPLAQSVSLHEAVKLNDLRNLRWVKERVNRLRGVNKTPEGEAMCLLLLGRAWIDTEIIRPTGVMKCLEEHADPQIVYCWTDKKSWQHECPDPWAARRYAKDMWCKYKARTRIAPKYCAKVIGV